MRNNHHQISIAATVFFVAVSITGCEKQGSTVVQEMAPRRLPDKAVYGGVDGIDAIKTVRDALQATDKEARLIAAFPADHETWIEPESKLQYTVAKSWAVTFYSQRQTGQLVHLVTPDGIKSTSFGKTEDGSEVGEALFPTLGNQKALAIANNLGLLRSDYRAALDVVTLHCVKFQGKWRHVWKLPYFGPRLPIWIDAVSGATVDIEAYAKEQ